MKFNLTMLQAVIVFALLSGMAHARIGGKDNNEEKDRSLATRGEEYGIFETEDTSVDTDGLAEDIKAAAELLGVGFDDAAFLLKQQMAFSQVVDKLQEDDSFLQAEMPEDLKGEFVIKCKKGEIPSSIRPTIEDFMKKYDAKVTTVATRLSMKEAEARGDRLNEILRKQGYSFVSYSIDGDTLELSAKSPPNSKFPGDDVVPKERAAKILGLDEGNEDLLDLELFVFDYNDEDPEGDEHTYGGRRISGGGSQCTTGFSVVHTSGTTGVTTAAHCTGMNWYDGVPPEGDYATSFQSQHNGSWGDVEWHTTAHIEPAQYYATPATRWPVRSIATSISKNQVVCVFSRMQGTRSCDRVYRTSVSQGSSKRLVAMRNARTVGGDSGGPWSFYDRAFGIHKGWKRIWFKRRNTWSRVSYLGAALGVLVRTL